MPDTVTRLNTGEWNDSIVFGGCVGVPYWKSHFFLAGNTGLQVIGLVISWVGRYLEVLFRRVAGSIRGRPGDRKTDMSGFPVDAGRENCRSILGQ